MVTDSSSVILSVTSSTNSIQSSSVSAFLDVNRLVPELSLAEQCT